MHKKLREFISQHSDVLRRDPWRERTLNVPNVGSRTNLGLQSPSNGGIMEQSPAVLAEPRTSNETGKHDVHFVGRIDREKFKVVSPEITTDEVIITDERIAHIEERHPGDYQRFGKYIPEILDGYKHMLEDDLPNTALLLKQIAAEDGARVKLVLRLHTVGDDPAYKNSIISLWEIGEHRWKNYERNKKILDTQE